MDNTNFNLQKENAKSLLNINDEQCQELQSVANRLGCDVEFLAITIERINLTTGSDNGLEGS